MAMTFRPGRGERDQDRPVPWRFRLALLGGGIAAWMLQLAARASPETVESLYARRAYPVIRDVTSTFTGWTGRSVIEIVLAVAAVVLAWRAVQSIRRIARGVRSVRNVAAQAVSLALALGGVLVMWGVLGWGLNYHRLPAAATAGLDVGPASAEELRRLVGGLSTRAAELREALPEAADGTLLAADDVVTALRRAPRAFGERIGDDEGLVGPGVTRPKTVRLAPLPWFGISGVFSMFTSEPNVVAALPRTELLAAACHELAHQLGWAREDEAEYVGYRACRAHPDRDYRYAATLAALQRAMRALRRADPAAAGEAAEALAPGVARDWREAARWWSRFDTPLAEAGAKVNDAYLKSQGQTAGIASYGLMVDLLVGDLRRDEARGRR